MGGFAGSASITSGLISTRACNPAQFDSSSPATVAALSIAPQSDETVEFGDFYAEPAAEMDVSLSSIYQIEGAKFAFQQSNGVGILGVLPDDAMRCPCWYLRRSQFHSKAKSLTSIKVKTPVPLRSPSGLENLQPKRCGRLLSGIRPSSITLSAYLSTFEVQGDPGTATLIDDLYLGPTNPLFANVAGDGIPDSWKVLNGLNPAIDYTGANDFDPALTDLQEYELGLNPSRGSVSDDSAVGLMIYAFASMVILPCVH